jgi:hypothetical protein
MSLFWDGPMKDDKKPCGMTTGFFCVPNRKNKQ